jgi:tripartite-type tricarboxylate transporter receptor subunit TctC
LQRSDQEGSCGASGVAKQQEPVDEPNKQNLSNIRGCNIAANCRIRVAEWCNFKRAAHKEPGLIKEHVRKSIFAALIAVALVVAPSSFARAYPERTITIIVPYPAGGGVDLMARMLGQRLTDLWKQPVVILNQPGAGGSVGAARAAKAVSDGYTLFMTTNSPLTTNPFLYKSLGYDTLRDFEAIVMMADGPMLLVSHPKLPVQSVKDLIALAKEKPGQIQAGISGNGATSHLAIMELSRLSGVTFFVVPYSGGPQMLTATLRGEIQVAFSDIVPALPLVQDGQLRALATPQLKRSAVAPSVPTVDESGLPRFNVTPWIGLFAPKGTPPDIVRRLNAETNRIFAHPDFRARLIAIGQGPVGANTPEMFEEFVRSEIPRWRDMVANAGLSIQ